MSKNTERAPKGDAQSPAAPEAPEAQPDPRDAELATLREQLAKANAERDAAKAAQDRAEVEHLEAVEQLEAERNQLAQLHDANRSLHAALEKARGKVEAHEAAAARRGAQGGPSSSSRRISLRALNTLAVVLDGVRTKLAPGDVFEATREECEGLEPGVHFTRDDE